MTSWLVVDCTFGSYRTVDDWSPRQSDARRYARLSDARLDARLLGNCRVVRLASRADTRRISRQDRLRALGYEMPSDEQRRENLASNVTIIQDRWRG